MENVDSEHLYLQFGCNVKRGHWVIAIASIRPFPWFIAYTRDKQDYPALAGHIFAVYINGSRGSQAKELPLHTIGVGLKGMHVQGTHSTYWIILWLCAGSALMTDQSARMWCMPTRLASVVSKRRLLLLLASKRAQHERSGLGQLAIRHSERHAVLSQ